MGKISQYSDVVGPKLSDKLIGTSVGYNEEGELKDVTYNFTLQQLLTLFIPNTPTNTLQGVLDNGNTATQDINLFGKITVTNLDVTDTANLYKTHFIEEAYIEGLLFDSLDLSGTTGQILSNTGSGVKWITPAIFTPTLQQVLEEGNISDIGIILDANIEANDIQADNLELSNNLKLDGRLYDSENSSGVNGQVLVSLGNGVEWQDLGLYVANSPLFINPSTKTISIQKADSTQDGYLSRIDWINFDGKQNEIVVTTNGNSGPSTLIGNVLNIPQYASEGLMGLTVSSPLQITSGVTPNISIPQATGLLSGFLSSTDWNTFNSKQNALSGTGIVISNSGVISYITDNSTNWNTAYNNMIVSAAVTGLSTKTLTLTQQDGGTITASWTDDNTDAVTSVFGRTGAVIAVNGDYNTSQVTENTNLYFTQARVSANTDVAANTALRHNPLTIGTANGLSLSVQQLSLGLASSSANGALSNTDWTTFNSKQNAILLTTLGTSGAATFIGNTLNIPNYAPDLSGYVPISRTLTINGTALDLSANRSWNVGTVTSVAALTLGTTGTDLSSSVSNGATTPVITLNVPTASAVNRGALSSADWTTFNNKQAAGNYITSLIGEATATGPGAASVTLNNSSVIAKVLSGFNVTAGSVNSADSILTAFGKLQNQINGLIGGSTFEGTWNASTNTPTLTSSVGVNGHYYVVSVAGNTNLNGVTDWNVGDWAIFHDSVWEKVDNTDSVISVNGQIGIVNLTTDNIPQGTTNLYFANSLSRAALSFAAGSGAYNNTTGVITIPTNNNQITNGAGYITLASLSAVSPLSYNSGTGAFSIAQSSGSTNGFLSSTDWTTFNNKQAQLNGTGFVKISGTTISYDNNTYYLASNPNAYIPLTALSAGAGISYNNTTGVIASTITQYTDALARAAISLTTTGTSGAATYNNTTGVLNIPQYADQFVGTVTSVGLTSSTSGVTIGSSPITTSGNITLAIATASGSQQGLLSSTDWTTFNNKQNALTNPITGTGTTNFLPKFTGASTLGNSLIFDNGTNVGIGTTSPTYRLSVLRTGSGIQDVLLLDNLNQTVGVVDGVRLKLRDFNIEASSTYGSADNIFTIGIGTSKQITLLQNGNVGIGTTDVDSRFKAELLNVASLRVGFNGTSVNFYDADNNIFRAGNGTERMRITSAGNVGIGTTSPQGIFEAVGLSYLTRSGQSLLINPNYGGANTHIQFQAVGNMGIAFATNGDNERMRITSGGNVGIGTTSPTSKVHSYSTAAYVETQGISSQSDSNIITLGAGSSGSAAFEPNYMGVNESGLLSSKSMRFSIYGAGGSYFKWSNNGSEQMRITSSGNVGVGLTDTGGYKLGISTNTLGINVQGFYSAGNPLILARTTYSGGSVCETQIRAYNPTNGVDADLGFLVMNGSSVLNEVIRIKGSSGNVGIGTTNPTSKLHVVGDGLFSGVVTAGGAANIDSSLSFQISTSGSGTQRWFGANKNGSYGLLVGYSEATSLSGVGAYIRQVTSDPMFFVVNNTTTALTLAATGAATFSSSVTAGGNIQSNKALVATGPNANWTGLGIFADIDGTFGRLGVYNYSTSSWGALSINNGSIYSSGNNGNVGIGTTSPDSRLHLGTNVNQSIKVNSANANAAFLGIFNDAAALTVNRDPATGNIQDATKATSAVYVRGEASNGYITFETTATNNGNSTERMRITSSGELLVGTTSALLSASGRGVVEINGTSSSVIGLKVGNSVGSYLYSTNTDTELYSTNALKFAVAGAERMRLTAAGNFGIGTTNPTQMFSVAGNAIIGQGQNRPVTYDSNGGNFRITANTGGWATGYYFNGSSGTFRGGFGAYGEANDLGWYFIGSDYNASTATYFLPNGNVGIGTTSPEHRLDVNGTGRFTTSTNKNIIIKDASHSTLGNLTSAITFSRPDGVSDLAAIFGGGQSGGLAIAARGGLSFLTGGGGTYPTTVQRMTIVEDGNVGIGTTSPNNKLYIVSSAQNSGLSVMDWNGAGGWGGGINLGVTGLSLETLGKIYTSLTNGGPGSVAGDLRFQTATGGALFDRMTITSTGNVGIGTTSPSERLTVSGNGTFSGSLTTAGLLVTNNRLWISANNPISDWISSSLTAGYSATNSYGWVNSAGSLVFGTNGAEAMRITSGNVGIGTTSPAERLSVVGKVRFFDSGYPYIDLGINTSNYWRIINDNPNDTFVIGKNGTSQFIINGASAAATFTGSVTATSFFASSDIRLKNIIKTNYNPTGIEAISYKWKDSGIDTKIHVGYSAQQVQEFMPDAVSKDSNGKLSVNYVEVLVAKIAVLEAKVRHLESN